MKKRIVSVMLLCVILTLLCTAATAAGSELSGLNIQNQRVTVTPLDANDQAVTASDGVYSGVEKFRIVCTDATNGEQYLAFIQSGNDGVPTRDNLYYIDVVEATGGAATVNAYPKDMEENTYTLWITSDSDGRAAKQAASFQIGAAAEPDVKKGDVNGDGSINLLDVMAMIDSIVGKTTLSDSAAAAADVNADGTVNLLDVMAVIDAIVGKTTL